jgi:hypothetical protein
MAKDGRSSPSPIKAARGSGVLAEREDIPGSETVNESDTKTCAVTP